MLIRIMLILLLSSVIGKSASASSPLGRISCSGIFSNIISTESPRPAAIAVQEMLLKARTQPNDIEVHDEKFYEKILKDPNFELGETYVDGLWDSPAIDDLTYKLIKAKEADPSSFLISYLRTPGLALRAVMNEAYRYARDRVTNRQTRERATNVTEEHYDAGNDLYRQMLDPTMTYTSGVWREGYTLEDAQNAKYDLICRKLGLKKGDHVLDIGSGFGGFARFAAERYGAKVTGVTLSVEQLKAARELSAHVPGVDFVFSDYRDIPYRFEPNTFDHVVSIEMIEAVGHKNLETYFEAAQSVLKDGGHFVIQAIASNKAVVNSNPWFSKYIFRDGVAPSRSQVDQAAKKWFGGPTDNFEMTHDYDRTLLEWHRQFTHAWPKLASKYSARFKRMWDFYLLSVAGGFRAEKVRLYQTVYVKGGGSLDSPKVRELPSVSEIAEMRQTAEQIAKTEAIIGHVDRETEDTKKLATPRNRGPQVPLPKEARIAVIGAGPGGLSAAHELRARGYTSVVIYDKAPEAGGKSHTMVYDGRAHDMGATMGVRYKYAQIETLAQEQGQKTIPFPLQSDYDLATGKAAPKGGLKEKLNLGYQALIYAIRNSKVTGKDGRGLEVPPDELSDPWQVVMDRQGLNAFGAKMKTYLTGYGYGGPETPAVFAYRMLNADAILGSALSKPIMWENGSQPIWKGLAQDLGVQTNAAIKSVHRAEKNVTIEFEDGRAPETFEKVIMAVDPSTTLGLLDASPEETAVFSQVQYMPYATFAVRVKGFSEGRSEVGYLRENMRMDRQGHPMAWIKRYPDDNLFIFHLFAPKDLTDDQIVSNINEDMRRLGATGVELVDSRRWPFFPHVDARAMRERKFYARAQNLQGSRNTVYINEALNMSTMPDAAHLGTAVADRLMSGEYGQ